MAITKVTAATKNKEIMVDFIFPENEFYCIFGMEGRKVLNCTAKFYQQLDSNVLFPTYIKENVTINVELFNFEEIFKNVYRASIKPEFQEWVISSFEVMQLPNNIKTFDEYVAWSDNNKCK